VKISERVAEMENKIEAVGELLAENGCDCDCDHGYDDHNVECDRCLACRIDAALFEKVTK